MAALLTFLRWLAAAALDYLATKLLTPERLDRLIDEEAIARILHRFLDAIRDGVGLPPHAGNAAVVESLEAHLDVPAVAAAIAQPAAKPAEPPGPPAA